MPVRKTWTPQTTTRKAAASKGVSMSLRRIHGFRRRKPLTSCLWMKGNMPNCARHASTSLRAFTSSSSCMILSIFAFSCVNNVEAASWDALSPPTVRSANCQRSIEATLQRSCHFGGFANCLLRFAGHRFPVARFAKLKSAPPGIWAARSWQSAPGESVLLALVVRLSRDASRAG